MNRRQFIGGVSGLSAITAGCLSDWRSGPSTKRRRIAVESSDDVAIEGTTMSVAVTDETITRDSSGKIRVSLQNTGASDSIFLCGFRPPFSTIVNTREDREDLAWYLFHPTNHSFTEDDYHKPHGCWWSLDREVIVAGVGHIIELHPEEEITVELDVVANGKRSECRPTGTYRFERTYNESPENSGQEDVFEWGFSLTITADD